MIVLDLRLTCQPAKAARVRVQEAPESGPVNLTAHGAVTVVDELRRVSELEAHLTAKA